MDTRNGGEIFYREVTSSAVLNLIAQDIRLAFRGFFNFRPTWFQFIFTATVQISKTVLHSKIFFIVINGLALRYGRNENDR